MSPSISLLVLHHLIRHVLPQAFTGETDRFSCQSIKSPTVWFARLRIDSYPCNLSSSHFISSRYDRGRAANLMPKLT